MILLLLCLLPDKPLPSYLPGDDVVHWSKSGDDYQTLEGKHCTVTDLKWDKYSRRIGYVVNSQGWGDFVTRRQWHVMREEFMRELNYPSWWMPFVEGKDAPR